MKTKKMTKWLFAALISFITMPALAQVDAPAGVAVGQVAPEIKMQTLKGETIQLSDYKGKYVVVDFWASWCPDCLRELPAMIQFYDEYHAKGVEFLGVSFDNVPEKLTAAVAKFNIPWAQVSEMKKWKETEINKAYAIKWIPSMYLIAPDGTVAYYGVNATGLGEKLKEVCNK